MTLEALFVMSCNRPISITVSCHGADTWVPTGRWVNVVICPPSHRFFEKKKTKSDLKKRGKNTKKLKLLEWTWSAHERKKNWLEHLQKMPSERAPKQLLYEYYQPIGRHDPGRPKRRLEE
jgi:hypothetical protein